MLTNEIKMIIEQAQREFRPHQLINSMNQQVDCSSTIPVVICADLNSLPESGVIEYLRTGKILANHVDFKELGYDSCLQKINTSDKPSELSHNLKLDCAYDKEITPYTNYTYDFKGMIDYIFYSRNLLKTVGLLGPLDIDWIKNNRIVGFPHPHVPSDHLPLMVELELFNPSTSNNSNNNNNSNMSLNTNNMMSLQQQSHNFHYQSNNGNGMRNNNHSHHNSNTNNHHHSNSNSNTNSNQNLNNNSSSSTSSSSNMGHQMSNGTNNNNNNTSSSNSLINNNNSFNYLHSNVRK